MDKPLLGCLQHILRQGKAGNHVEAAIDRFTAGEQDISPDELSQVCQELDYVAEGIKLTVKQLNELEVGSILLLKQGDAVIFCGLANDNVVVSRPGHDPEKMQYSLSQFKSMFSGKAITIASKLAIESRVKIKETDSRHWFFNAIKQFKHYYFALIIAALLINIFALASPFYVMNVYDRVLPNAAFDTLWVLAISVLIIYLFDFIVKISRAAILDNIGKKLDVALSNKIYQHVLWLQASFKPKSAGSFSNNLRDFDSLREFFASATVSALVDLPFVLLFLIVMFAFIGVIAVVPMIFAAILFVIVIISAKKQKGLIAESMQYGSQKHAIAVESVATLETIKTLNAEHEWSHRWRENVEQGARVGKRLHFLSSTTTSLVQWVMALNTVFVVVVGVYLSASGAMSMGAIIASVMLSSRMLAPMAGFGQLILRYDQVKLAFAGLNQLMNQPVERPDNVEFVELPTLKGQIQFEQVDFSFEAETDNPFGAPVKIPVIKNVSFTIKPGEKVAIIGRIGSGKTTLLKLLMNLYSPQAGVVKVDGLDIKQIDPASLRKNIAYSPQEPSLFYGTLKKNVTIGKSGLSDEKLVEALKLSGVAAMANANPMGLSMIISEFGRNLSGGQRQAVSIARAFCSDAPVLILDEPTSSMDLGTERMIIDSVKQFAKDKTLIVTTHKTSSIDLVDRIIWMEQGRIIADGPKQQVLEKLKGFASGDDSANKTQSSGDK